MKNFSINRIEPVFIFSFFVFAVLPFIYSSGLLDPELSFRFIGITLIVFCFFVYFLIRRNKINLPPLNQKLTFIFAGYILLSLLSIVFAANSNESIYELLRLVIFFLFYLGVSILIKKNDDALPVIVKNINIGILIFSGIALYQLFPLIINYFEKGKPFVISLSVASSLGNKNFYSETLLMSLPFIVYGMTLFKNVWKKISVFNFILILFTIFILQTTSVWLGFLISSLLVWFFYRKIFLTNKKMRMGIIFFSILIFLTGGAIIISKPAFFKSTVSKAHVIFKYISDPKTLEVFSIENNNSTYERIILWRNSFKMIKEHPIFGVGLSEWKIYFPKYGMGKAPYMNTGIIRFEKPHNDFLLTWCESGFQALVCYIAIFIISFAFCRKVLKGKQTEKEKWLIRLMIAGLTGFMVISFFGYPSQRPFTMIFLMLQLALVQSEYQKLLPVKRDQNVKKTYTIIFIAGILISGYALNMGMQRLKAEMHMSNALRAQKYKNWGIMYRESLRAKSDYFSMDYTGTPVSWYTGFASFYAGDREQAFINFKEAEKINPYHFNLLNDIGTCYDLQGNSEMAKSYYYKAIGISPLFPDAIINLSVIYYNAGNIDSAYTFISSDNLGTHSNYAKDIKVILHAKAMQIVQQVQDSLTRQQLLEKINDDKWLFSLHKEAKLTNSKLENLLLRSKN